MSTLFPPESPFLQTTCISLGRQFTNVAALVTSSVPASWNRRWPWALWSFFVRWPASIFPWTPQVDLVGHYFPGPTKPNKPLNDSKAVWASQALQVKVPEYIGLVHGVNHRKLDSLFRRQGHHLNLFWDSNVDSFLVLCIVYVMEPVKWPVNELPIGVRRMVHKQALCTLEDNETNMTLNITPCLGPLLKGPQEGYKPWPDHPSSNAKHLVVICPWSQSGDSIASMKCLSIERRSGLTQVLHEISFELDSSFKPWTSTWFRVPFRSRTWLTMAFETVRDVQLYSLVIFEFDNTFDKPMTRIIRDVLSDEEGSTPLSLEICDAKKFYVAYKTADHVCYIRTIDWTVVFYQMECFEYMRVHYPQDYALFLDRFGNVDPTKVRNYMRQFHNDNTSHSMAYNCTVILRDIIRSKERQEMPSRKRRRSS